jgi:hypothetical protein
VSVEGTEVDRKRHSQPILQPADVGRGQSWALGHLTPQILVRIEEPTQEVIAEVVWWRGDSLHLDNPRMKNVD